MTKKNIRPQQVAPVERETISTAKDQSGQVTAQSKIVVKRILLFLLRATTRSKSPHSTTHLKKYQKSVSTSLGARFASMN